MTDAISVQKLKESVKYRIVFRPLGPRLGGEKPQFKTTFFPKKIALDQALPRLHLIVT